MRHAPYICGESCPRCQEFEEAFEAMRKALTFWQESGLDILRHPKLYRDAEIQVRTNQARAALALADKAKSTKPKEE